MPWPVFLRSIIVYYSNRRALYFAFSLLSGSSSVQLISPPEFWAHLGSCSYYLAHSAFRIPLFGCLILPSPLRGRLLLSRLVTTSYAVRSSSVMPVL